MKRFKEKPTEEEKPDLTPMIDIIFQLLIFFVLTAKFIAFEGQLQAYLPKDRGLSAGPPPVTTGVSLFLDWDTEGKVLCLTTQYEMGGDARQQYTFPFDPAARQLSGGGWITDTVLRSGAKEGKVTYDYAAPDLREIEAYLRYRRDNYHGGVGSKGLPVEITPGKAAPWEMVVSIIDICKRLGIADLSITAQELEY